MGHFCRGEEGTKNFKYIKRKGENGDELQNGLELDA